MWCKPAKNLLSAMTLSTFQTYTSTQPAECSVEQIVDTIRRDDYLKSLTIGYRTSGDKAVKEHTMLFSPAARFSGGKRVTDITALTGLSMADFDHLPETEIGPLRAKINADAHTLFSYVTISGKGLRVIFRYGLDGSLPLDVQKKQYPAIFAVCNAYYSQLLGIEADKQCKNVGRLSGMAHDPQVYYNPDAEIFTASWVAEQQTAAKRREKAERQHNRELAKVTQLYGTLLSEELENEGATYRSGAHNDYVMRLGYKLNAFGIPLDAALTWATAKFSDYADTAQVIRSCYGRTGEHGTRRCSLRRSSNDKYQAYASVEDIKAFLRQHAQFRHNVVTSRIEVLQFHCHPERTTAESKEQEVEEAKEAKDECQINKTDVKGAERPAISGCDAPATSLTPITPDYPKWTILTDNAVNSLWAEMSKTARVNVQDVHRVINSDFVPGYHPFRQYLVALPEWKEGDADHLAGLAATVTVKGGSEAQERFARYLKKWLVAMVAAWINDDTVNNVILVLIGEQGAYKTTWFSCLLPPELRQYFRTKTNSQRMLKDDLLALAEYGLICCEELDTMKPAELNQLKAAVTMASVDERAAYARYAEHRPHIASFCGTGNNIQFLSDPTGNRRWLPFEIESILSPREHPFNHQGIYAQAYALIKSGYRYWFTQDEVREVNSHNRRYETPKLEHELVMLYFRKPQNELQGQFMTTARILQHIGANITQKLSAIHVGRALSDLGFERRQLHGVRGFIVEPRTGDEIRQYQITMALHAVKDD